jgi:hypothetical protein
MKLSIKQPNPSFASVLVAFSLLGFFWPLTQTQPTDITV